MKRSGLVVVAITALLAAVLAVPGAAAARRTSAAATVQVNINPIDRAGHLKPGYEIATTIVHSWCYSGSDKVPGAYRCSAGHAIFDPCFPRIDGHGGYHGSYCLRVPWGHAGIILRGRHAAPDRRKGRAVWAVHTTDGYGCVDSPGGNDFFHRQGLLWRCDHGDRWLLVTFDRTSPQWQATEVVYVNGRPADPHRVGIPKAWFGVSRLGLR